MPFNRPLIIFVLALVVALFALGRRSDQNDQTVSRSRLVMGTVVEITAIGSDSDRVAAAVVEAFVEMERIERLMSPHLAQSDVARLSAATGPLEVTPETAEVVALGLQVALASGGAFDLTLGRLKALWDVEGEQPQIPEAAGIGRALLGIGPRALQLQGQKVEKADPLLAVDLGGIAKGYAIDRALALLQRSGVGSASINAGGDLRLLGDRQGRPWRIGIQHPRKAGQLLATLELTDAAVVTSGDYERFFEQDGVRYHHLFDPRTGYPAKLCQSVTLVAPNAMLADALATAVFVLGPQQGLALLEQFPGAEALVVAADGSRQVSPGLESRLQWR